MPVQDFLAAQVAQVLHREVNQQAVVELEVMPVPEEKVAIT
jgi:hypothetical protein